MAEVTIDTLATAVAEQLTDYNAVVSYAPEYNLAELSTLRCVVVPLNVEYRSLSRGNVETQYRLDIGILYRAKSLDIGTMLGRVQDIVQRFFRKTISGTVCLKAVHEPLYDAETLRERNQFTAVVSLTFKAV